MNLPSYRAVKAQQQTDCKEIRTRPWLLTSALDALQSSSLRSWQWPVVSSKDFVHLTRYAITRHNLAGKLADIEDSARLLLLLFRNFSCMYEWMWGNIPKRALTECTVCRESSVTGIFGIFWCNSLSSMVACLQFATSSLKLDLNMLSMESCSSYACLLLCLDHYDLKNNNMKTIVYSWWCVFTVSVARG